MKKFKRIMVGLDLSQMDDVLIERVAAFAKYFLPSKVYFTHIGKDYTIPQSVRDSFPTLNEPMDEKVKNDLQIKVSKACGDQKLYDVEVEVLEGKTEKTMLHHLAVKNIDLLVLGRKDYENGSGILPQRLLRNCGCSVLFVGSNSSEKFKKILVPTDFSDQSIEAIHNARFLEEMNVEPTEIILHHVFELPRMGGQIQYSHKKILPMVTETIHEEFDLFLKRFNLDDSRLTRDIIYDENFSGASITLSRAKKMDADIIVMSSQGKSGLKRMILGSYAEKVVKGFNEGNLLIIK